MENLKICRCKIRAKHEINNKPTICACTGPDPLYEECGGDYERYKVRSQELNSQRFYRRISKFIIAASDIK